MLQASSKTLAPTSPITGKVTKCILGIIYDILMNRVSWALRRTFDEGGLQEFALVGTAPYLTAKIPENINEDEASTLPTALNTASIALYDSDGFGFPSPFSGDRTFGKDKAIFVTGGSSVIGLGGNFHLSIQC
jgi:NADPH:quinone reductase-like Zn-dependent oxidoreductase